ncbi:E3 ubiquitin-protein ligase SHPRH-like [Diadema setosum]|uniref:E3 ubiquitin-protein ligase SHPRH-like n=1 Tax=Diadema setosum TaxID=31175 RepID=UPI003B3B06EF
MRKKRKPSSTRHLEAEKRQCLSWNMYDAAENAGPSTSSSSQDEGIQMEEGMVEERLPGGDPPQESRIILEPRDGNIMAAQPLDCNGREDFPEQFSITRSSYQLLRETSKFKMKVHFTSPDEAERCGLLCHLVLQLDALSPGVGGVTRPKTLPFDTACLYMRDSPGHDFLVCDDRWSAAPLGPPSRKDAILGRDRPLTFAVRMEKRPGPKCLESFEALHKHKKHDLVRLCVRDYDCHSGRAVLEAWLLRDIVTRPVFSAQWPTKKKQCAPVQHVMNWFHGFSIPAPGKCKFHKRYDYDALFGKVRQYHQTQEEWLNINVQHPALIPVLRPYQRDAVRWMVKKEQNIHDGRNRGSPHVLWKEFKTVDDKVLYYNPDTGEITDQRQEMPGVFPGGILADEMGLGKTVEVLATILANPRWREQDPTASDATIAEKLDESENDDDAFPIESGSGDVAATPETACSESEGIENMEASSLASNMGYHQGEMSSHQNDNTDAEIGKVKSPLDLQGTSGEGLSCGGSVGTLQEQLESMTRPVSVDAVPCSSVAKRDEDSQMNTRICAEPRVAAVRLETENPRSGTVVACTVSGGTDAPFSSANAGMQEITSEGVDVEAVVEKGPSTCGANLSMRSPDTDLGTCPMESPESSQQQDACSSQDASEQGLEQQTDMHKGLTGKEEEQMDDGEPLADREETKVFQCICGSKEDQIDPPTCVRCLECDTWQHAACVNFEMHMPAEPHEGQRVDYWCPHCFPRVDPLPSGATLIISPATISHQWVDEINRHIDSTTLKILVYQGVKKDKYVQPKTLAGHDIVITTYNTLQNELVYANMPHPGMEGRNLRHTKRYMTTPSPLPCVEWWRVCLDEAQMIECPTAKSAEMALKLSAKNRWCVTGTPIQKSLDDLYGLFLFLGVEPFWVKHWWDKLLSAPYSRGNREPLQKALCKIFWRTAKRDVLEQIAIPPQKEIIHWLNFSAVESHFYKRKHEECSTNFTTYSHKTSVLPDTKLSTLDRKSLQRLLGPLLRLRQACCHPHVVRGEFTAMQKKRHLSMRDLLTNMIGKAEVESDGAHRQLVCALNGLAAIHCIRDEIAEAVKLYREVLKSAEENKAHIRTDKLQLMHAIHNMRAIQRDRPEVVEPMPEDDDLPRKMESFRQEYLIRSENLVINSLQSLQPITDKVKELKKKIPSGPPWYLDGIQWVVMQGLGADLVDKLKTDMEAKSEAMGLVDKFRDVRGFQYILVSELGELAELYEAAWKGVVDLRSRLDSGSLLAEATDCHLRPFKGREKHTCAFCKVADQLQSYEMKLFSFDVRNLDLQNAAGPAELTEDEEEPVNALTAGPHGTWAASETEKALRILYGFIRQCHADRTILDEGAIFLEMLEQQRKEFKPLRAYWGAMRDRVAAMDELEMAMLRLRVKLPGEETDPASQPYIIEPLEVDQQRYKFMNDRIVAQNDLRRKLGQLVYLQNLCRAQYDNVKDGHNPEPCPVCVRPLGVEWTVLQCGHSFCSDCMEILLKRSHVAGCQRAVRCAICRQRTEGAEVTYASTSPPPESQPPLPEEARQIHVVGDHSTKIEAVVRALIILQDEEPGAKVLIFSTWTEVLDLISRALKQNKIKFQNCFKGSSSKHFQTALLEFKHEPDITALLLPVHSGSKGLNIIEATHVFLVEPILNPASEMQAVGRVHRIGQTRQTFVHRFLVHNTIEEKLHSYLRDHSVKDGLNSVETDTGDMTLSDLEKLFASET